MSRLNDLFNHNPSFQPSCGLTNGMPPELVAERILKTALAQGLITEEEGAELFAEHFAELITPADRVPASTPPTESNLFKRLFPSL